MFQQNKEEKIKELRWLNLFLKNLFFVIVVGGLHYMTDFNSKTVFLITGMLLVYITWQFNDYINYKKKIQLYGKI